MSLAASLHRQYKTARTETHCHLLLKIWQMAIQTSASRGYVLFDIKMAFMPSVVWCRKGHTRILKLSAVCRTHPTECSKLGKTQIIADAKRGVVRNTGFCGQIYRRLLYLELTYEFPGYQIPASASVPLICQSSVSVFHLPEGCGVRRERTATSKVVRLPGEQVNSCAAACVEMRREAFGIGVDGD